MSWSTGHCFQFFDTQKKAHLYVIIAHDREPPTRCLAVNITSIRDGVPYDRSCVFAGGEHPCITGRCWAWYRRACVWDVTTLTAKERAGDLWRPDQKLVDWKIVLKLQHGGLQSEETNPDNKDFLKKYLKL